MALCKNCREIFKCSWCKEIITFSDDNGIWQKMGVELEYDILKFDRSFFKNKTIDDIRNELENPTPELRESLKEFYCKPDQIRGGIVVNLLNTCNIEK